nr:hypothetical protein [uncultured Draconibacterium sp.]
MISKEEIKKTLSKQSEVTLISEDKNLEFEIWSIDDIDNLNKSYEVDEFIPGYYGIGSNGGDEMLTIELNSGIVFSIPFIPMDSSERIEIAKSIYELIK